MRNNQRIFIVLFIFFTVVALGSLLLLSAKGSVFNRNRDSFGAQPAVLDNSTIIADESDIAVSTEEEVQPEQAPEPEPEPEPESEPIAEEPVKEEPGKIRYFTFTVSTRSTVLNVRENPGMDAKINKKLPKNTKGYILKPGAEWSYIRSEKGSEGYCSNQYMDIIEVTADDFPEELRDRVEAATEDLPVNIFGE